MSRVALSFKFEFWEKGPKGFNRYKLSLTDDNNRFCFYGNIYLDQILDLAKRYISKDIIMEEPRSKFLFMDVPTGGLYLYKKMNFLTRIEKFFSA